MRAFQRREYKISTITQDMIDQATNPIKITQVEYDTTEMTHILYKHVKYLEDEGDFRSAISIQTILDLQDKQILQSQSL